MSGMAQSDSTQQSPGASVSGALFVHWGFAVGQHDALADLERVAAADAPCAAQLVPLGHLPYDRRHACTVYTNALDHAFKCWDATPHGTASTSRVHVQERRRCDYCDEDARDRANVRTANALNPAPRRWYPLRSRCAV